MSINEATLERIKAQLRQGKDIGGNVPQDLYSHLTEVFNRILLHHPEDAYDKFEEISALVKQTDLKFKDPKYDFEVNEPEQDRELTFADKWVIKSKNLLNEVNDLIPQEDKKLLSKDKKFAMPNFQEEAEMLDWAGVNFGEETTYLLSQALKRLAQMSGAERINFCGKIYGTQNDYWIASGVLLKAEETVNDRNFEKRGQGVNRLVYWVTTNLLSDWVQLPDVFPEQIVAARKIKHVFTGDLNAQFDSNPTFPGRERHLLRATLARIFHATAIVPKGLYEFDEETSEIKFSDEFSMPGTTELQSLEIWSNLNPIILKIGRTSHLEAPEGLDEDAQAAYDIKIAEDPAIPPFTTTIFDHEKMKGLDFAWISKIVGDTQQYNLAPPKEGTVCYAVNVIKSLRWPGAVTVSKGGKFCNFYLGYGMKKGDSSYQPTEPPEVQRDPEEQEQMPEPTPLTPPEEQPEEDTDKEEKEEEDE